MIMKFRLYREFGALNSKDVFDAFEQGINNLGLNTTDDSDGIPVIWSVLWRGRMLPNKHVYDNARKNNKPVVIIEVGNFSRGVTWRVSIDNVNSLGYFGNKIDLDYDRPKKLGIELKTTQANRKPDILIAAQHEESLQWHGQLPIKEWVLSYINEIRKYTDRPIIVRPHPRSLFVLTNADAKLHMPRRIQNSYDGFDINYSVHCVINHNSGPGVQAAINGTPIIVDSSSLASPVSDKLSSIESIQMFDRSQWIIELSHTEWTREEIAQGLPLRRLIPEIEHRIS